MRKYYIDNLRTVTVLVVVLFHVVYMFNNLQEYGVIGGFFERQWWDHFQTLVYPWIMVLLFAVAGMSARWSLGARTAKEFFRTRTDKLLVPVTLGLLAFHWITGYFNVSISGAGEQFFGAPMPIPYFILCLSGTGVLWFLQMLWLFSLLLLLVRKLEKDRLYALCEKIPAWVLPLLALPLWGAAQILNTPIIIVYRFGFYGLAFFIGYFILSHDSIMDRLEKLWLPLGIIAALLGIAEVWVYRWQNYTELPIRDSFLSITYAWLASLALLAGMKHFCNKPSRVMTFLNRRSWTLYIFHYTFLAAAAWYMKDTGIPAAAQYLIITIAAFGGAWGFGEIISRIPVLRFWILGIHGKKKSPKKEETTHVQ